MIEYYTDGSSKNNGTRHSIGGFGVVRLDNGKLIKVWQDNNIEGVTNNQMELEAIAWAIDDFLCQLDNDKECIIYTDSSYSLNSLTIWYKNWERNGWVKSDGSTIKNLHKIRLITSILDGIKKNRPDLSLTLKKVEGHAGVDYNELADKLATGEIKMEDINGDKKEN